MTTKLFSEKHKDIPAYIIVNELKSTPGASNLEFNKAIRRIRQRKCIEKKERQREDT